MFSRTRSLVRSGDAARDARNWPVAITAYEKALRRKPHLARVWVQYGHALKESGAAGQALEAYRRADGLEPESADTHLQIGRALSLIGEMELAIEHFRRSAALGDFPSDATNELIALRQRLRPDMPRLEGMPDRLRFVNLGTTGTCNASCVHCPTGKAETAHVPRGTMPIELFEKIIDGIVDNGLLVTDQIAFGLFGDALVDPLVVRRAEYVRAKLPEVRLSINTNGAAFNLAKHAPLKHLAQTVALHCESLDPETYNDLMRPLRLQRVQPKFEEILRAFPGKVAVSVPISARNRHEALSIRQWFMERGAREVVYDALSSRCAEDRSVFDSLALNPRPIRCAPVIMEDLIVDCDGHVLICCQDFQRVEGIGSLATESFADVLMGMHRAHTRKLLAEGRHQELATCSRCFADIRGEFDPLRRTGDRPGKPRPMPPAARAQGRG